MDRNVKNALSLGLMCIFSYLGCYMARSVLSVVATDMRASTSFTVEDIGVFSTAFMIVYACGQLVNGRLGDLFRAKWLVGGGLFFAGVFNFLMPFSSSVILTTVIYAVSGFFQSMIYSPLMRVVAENTLPKYASRCSLGFSVASFLGTPVATLLAAFFNWKYAFFGAGIFMMFLGFVCFVFFTYFEKKGVIVYKEKVKGEKQKTDVVLLIKRGIIIQTIVAILTGIVRTSVVFWIPTYLVEYLNFSADGAGVVVSFATIMKSMSPYFGVLLIYERFFKRRSNSSTAFMFLIGMVGFLGMYFFPNPVINIVFMTVALLLSGCASSMVFSVYCPSLYDTGMVSTATGFLDACSYLGAALANFLFANAITSIGWKNLILVWSALMLVGLITFAFAKKNKTA